LEPACLCYCRNNNKTTHYIFDFIVHTPDLTIFGDDSFLIGLGLWNHIYIALIVEIALYFAGLYIYITETRGVGFSGKYGIYIFSLVLVAAAFISQVLSPRPQNGNEVAGSALLSISLVILISYWLDRKRIPLNSLDSEIPDQSTAL
jgi:hypothetical protein